MPYNYEHCFKTPKKKWIYVPTKECKEKGVEFNNLILSKWTVPSFYYHFKSGGHVSAIKIHLNHSYFAKIDIKNFFSNITKNKIIRAIKNIGLTYEKAKYIAEWSTVSPKDTDTTKRSLPYGFVQSQLIATLCLDNSALGCAFKNEIPRDVYLSVYVDDILISSDDRSLLSTTYDKLSNLLEVSGLILNTNKSHTSIESSTVFNIDIERDKLEINADRFQKFRNEIDIYNPSKTTAIISYVSSICPEQGEMLEEMIA